MTNQNPRVLEFMPKMRQPLWSLRDRWAMAKAVFMTITPEEAKQIDRLGRVWNHMFWSEGVNMKFIVVPNGAHLPVPQSHYACR